MPSGFSRGAFLALASAVSLEAQTSDSLTRAYTAAECPPCAGWNEPTQPVRLFGNTYYVGTRGLASLLITSDSGHILVDAGLPRSAPHIMESVRALGFRVEDIRLIVTSHVHYDAGGVAAIQRASGARVAASPWGAKVLATGKTLPDDPQYAIALAYPGVTGTRISEVQNGETLRVGPLAVTARFTPGHTPGGTTWTWRSCENGDCRDVVYADSQTPVSAEGFRFSDSRSYPRAVQDFERSFSVLSTLSCDVLVTPHPAASRLWERIQSKALHDREACRRYAANARNQLNHRLARERQSDR